MGAECPHNEKGLLLKDGVNQIDVGIQNFKRLLILIFKKFHN